MVVALTCQTILYCCLEVGGGFDTNSFIHSFVQALFTNIRKRKHFSKIFSQFCMFKSSITHWCVTRPEGVKHFYRLYQVYYHK